MFFCWIEINLSRSIFKISTYATKLFTFCNWFYLVASCFCTTIKRRFCEFFIKSIRKFEKFFHFHVFCMIFKFFFFVISVLRRRVANELLNSTDLNSFREKIWKINLKSVESVTCSVFKLLKTFVVINVKICKL